MKLPAPFQPNQYIEYTRSTEYLNPVAGISITDIDQIEIGGPEPRKSGQVFLRRKLVETHLSGGAVVAAPPGDPIIVRLRVSPDGTLNLTGQESDPTEFRLDEIYLSLWNQASNLAGLEIDPKGKYQGRILYRDPKGGDSLSLTGSYTLDSKTGWPSQMILRSPQTHMPGGDDKVSMKVIYNLVRH